MSVSTESARLQAIETQLKAIENNPNVERINIPWKGSQILASVIKIPLSTVVLNPFSHRIKAQLESHPEGGLVAKDPFSEAAQEVISDVLRNVEGFERLKDNLGQEGQRDAGVITRVGVLVNANTRAVALRDLGESYIRVAVLPSGATEQEISEVESDLQVRRDFKQDYTFTNQLLFLEDLEKFKYSDERLALRLGLATSDDPKAMKQGIAEVQQYRRLLAMVREIRGMSDKRLPYAIFDRDKQILIDLDQKYEALKEDDPQKAQRMRHMRMIGLVSGNTYRELRSVDPDFLDEHLMQEIEEHEILGPIAELLSQQTGSTTPLPGLDLLGDSIVPLRSGTDPKPLLELIVKSAGQPEVTVPSEDGSGTVAIDRQQFLNHLQGAIDRAANEKLRDQRKEDALAAPNRP